MRLDYSDLPSAVSAAVAVACSAVVVTGSQSANTTGRLLFKINWLLGGGGCADAGASWSICGAHFGSPLLFLTIYVFNVGCLRYESLLLLLLPLNAHY